MMIGSVVMEKITSGEQKIRNLTNTQNDANLIINMIFIVYLNSSNGRQLPSWWSTCWDMVHVYFWVIHVPILMKTKFQSLNLEYVLLYTIRHNPTFEFWKSVQYITRYWPIYWKIYFYQNNNILRSNPQILLLKWW